MKARLVRPFLGISFALALGFATVVSLSASAGSPAKGRIEGTVSYHRGDKGLLVYVVKAPGHFAAPKKDPLMNQSHMHFVPHVLPVLEGSTVTFLNSDAIAHNVFSPDHEGYNLGSWGQGEKRTYTFKKAGVYTQLCSLHPEMEAYVVVLQNPYYATTDAHGHFVIKGVPDGHYELKVWGEKLHSKEKKKHVSVDLKGGAAKVSINL